MARADLATIKTHCRAWRVGRLVVGYVLLDLPRLPWWKRFSIMWAWLLLAGCGAGPATTTQPSAASTVAAALRAALAEVCATVHPAEPAARFALALTCALLAPPAEVPDAGHGG